MTEDPPPWTPEGASIAWQPPDDDLKTESESEFGDTFTAGILAFMFYFFAFILSMIGVDAHEHRDTAGRYAWLIGAVPAAICLVVAVVITMMALWRHSRNSND
ncbi:TPA: hypothetical protein DCF80_03565 [Candidatus Saccharibacteria bacterium]|nr:hypothetical protein [Candidatus Saccharibacteria bacterium]HRK40691.1 hypothetical protein [Candidatus Saccharibacteria bacterium]